MEGSCKVALLMLVLVLAVESESVPRSLRSIYSPGDYLQASSVVPNQSVFPKCDDWRNDITCMDSGSLRSHAHLPIFKKGREHLASRNMRHAFLLLYCPASTQNYHILVYDTDQGIVRLNLYSNQGALTVTETRTLDSALALSQQIRNNF